MMAKAARQVKQSGRMRRERLIRPGSVLNLLRRSDNRLA